MCHILSELVLSICFWKWKLQECCFFDNITYIYICVCIYIYICLYICTYIYICICLCRYDANEICVQRLSGWRLAAKLHSHRIGWRPVSASCLVLLFEATCFLNWKKSGLNVERRGWKTVIFEIIDGLPLEIFLFRPNRFSGAIRKLKLLLSDLGFWSQASLEPTRRAPRAPSFEPQYRRKLC